MKIAVITETFHPNVGGQEVRYLELGRELVRKGHTVSVFTVRLSPSHPKREVIDGIETHRITDAFRFFQAPGLTRNPASILRFTWDLARRRAVLEGYDFLMFNIWPLMPPIVLPRVVRSPSAVDWCEIRRSVFWDLIYRLLSNPRVFHVAVSDGVRETLCQRYGLSRSRTQVIESGIHYTKYQCEGREKQDKNILFFGRLAAHKNPLMVLEAFCHQKLGGKGYSLHFAGDGPLLAELQEQARLADSVHVYGSVDEATKVSLLRRASLLVLPSRREGFPRVIAEAAAAGTPTLTTAFPENGSAAVVGQYGIGWVCAPDTVTLGAAMEKYASKNDGWQAIFAACQEAARTKLDWTAVGSELIRFVEEKI